MSMTALASPAPTDGEDMSAFKARMHGQIKAELEPTVLAAKSSMIQRLKATRDEKAKAALLKEYNDQLASIEASGVQRLNDEIVKERIRRQAEGLTVSVDVGSTRAQSRMGGFVPDASSGVSELGDWESRPGHVRSKSSLGNKASLLSGTRPGSSAGMYTNAGSRPPTAAGRPSYPFVEDGSKFDDARARKFAEEQARLDRAHTPGTNGGDEMLRKFAEEQARYNRAHSPEITRTTDAQRRFAEEQARLHRAHSPAVPMMPQQTMPGAMPGGLSESPKSYRTSTGGISISPDAARTRKVSITTAGTSSSPIDVTTRLAAYAEQQQREYRQFTPAISPQASSGSRASQNPPTPTMPSSSTPVPKGKPIPVTNGSSSSAAMAAGRRNGNGFGRFPLNERDHDAKSAYADDDTTTLTKVEVLFFDLDGTVLNWHGTVAEELRRVARRYWAEADQMDWEGFAMKWKEKYMANLRTLAEHGSALAAPEVYARALDQLLSAKEASEVAAKWTPAVRTQLVEIWTRLRAWPDVEDGMKSIKTIKTVGTVCNESLRTQTQINRHAGLSWDVCLSGSVLGSFKGVPDTYLQAALTMTLPPANCALVSAHIDELRVAAGVGFKTVYVHRASERALAMSLNPSPSRKGKGQVNGAGGHGEVRSKAEGGEVDVVVDSFEHLALVLGCDI
uniref:HAD-like protein n=1 Tax=Mycena chlorophos TaxID=658473 RepID=A0ABQ0LM87_MYCCL|nr:predicted protein [Mycena chlorophos]